MTKLRWILAGVLAVAAFAASGQNIRGRYVSKAEVDGTIYHTLPCTLFELPGAGDLSFDITYKEHKDGHATINFSYPMAEATPIDSACFAAGSLRLQGSVTKFYIESDKKSWKHRYSLRVQARRLSAFFDEGVEPQVTLWGGGRAYVFRVKPSAWKSYAPVGRRIFEMIRLNEQN